jgi:hypothetical protein
MIYPNDLLIAIWDACIYARFVDPDKHTIEDIPVAIKTVGAFLKVLERTKESANAMMDLIGADLSPLSEILRMIDDD